MSYQRDSKKRVNAHKIFHMRQNQILSENWLDEDKYGVAIVGNGIVRLNARLIGSEREYFTVKTYKRDEVILIRMLASRLPDNIEIELEGGSSSYINFVNWDEYKKEYFKSDVDLSSILIASVDTTVDLVYRAMAKRAFTVIERMAIILLEQVSLNSAHLDLYYKSDKPGSPEYFVNVFLEASDVEINWGLSRTSMFKSREPLSKAGVISDSTKGERFLVDLYALKEFIEKHSIITPFV